MQTIQFDIDDNKVDTFLAFIDTLKEDVIKNLKIVSHDSTDNYIRTAQFQKDKETLQQRFADIESGKTICVPWYEGFSDLDTYIDTIS